MGMAVPIIGNVYLLNFTSPHIPYGLAGRFTCDIFYLG